MNRPIAALTFRTALALFSIAGCASEPTSGPATTAAAPLAARPEASGAPSVSGNTKPPPAAAVVDPKSAECSAFGSTSERCFRTEAEACADIHCPASSCVLTAMKPSIAVCDKRDPIGIEVGSSRDHRVASGTSCAGYGEAVPKERAKLAPDARTNRWTTRDAWSCGCAKGSVFTLVYEPKTSPLKVRLCKDQSADPCQGLCGGPIAWDLSKALRDAGANGVELSP